MRMCPRSGGEFPEPQSVLPAPPLSSELGGLPYRRHFPWNLILLSIFVSDVGVSGDRCCSDGGRRDAAWVSRARSWEQPRWGHWGRQGYFHPTFSSKTVHPLFPNELSLFTPATLSFHYDCVFKRFVWEILELWVTRGMVVGKGKNRAAKQQRDNIILQKEIPPSQTCKASLSLFLKMIITLSASHSEFPWQLWHFSSETNFIFQLANRIQLANRLIRKQFFSVGK